MEIGPYSQPNLDLCDMSKGVILDFLYPKQSPGHVNQADIDMLI